VKLLGVHKNIMDLRLASQFRVRCCNRLNCRITSIFIVTFRILPRSLIYYRAGHRPRSFMAYVAPRRSGGRLTPGREL